MPFSPPVLKVKKPVYTGQGVSPLIQRLAPQYGIDPHAAQIVARGEGGLVNRTNDVGDLAGGGSYGPFQLYAKGALPKQFVGRPQAADQWAWSPEGIKYALSRMQQAGASGLTGRAAVETIIRKFERPADPNKSIALALSRLGAAPGSANPIPRQNPVAGQLNTQGTAPLSQPTTNPRATALVQGLAGGRDIFDLIQELPSLPAFSQNQAPSRPQRASASGIPQTLTMRDVPTKANQDWRKWVGDVEHRSGPSAAHKDQTLEFVSKVAQVYGKPLTPWGNESHSLTTVNGTPSQHGTGDAADIPASGAELIRMGQAALVAAGADPAWARKQTGGLFNIGGRQVIFATNQGGNHFDHVHVGL